MGVKQEKARQSCWCDSVPGLMANNCTALSYISYLCAGPYQAALQLRPALTSPSAAALQLHGAQRQGSVAVSPSSQHHWQLR